MLYSLVNVSSMNFVVLYSISSAGSSGDSGEQGSSMSCGFSSSIWFSSSRGFPFMSLWYPNSFSLFMDVLASFGLKCVSASSEQSYLIVPSLFTDNSCFALIIPFMRCSEMCSLFARPLTPFIRSGIMFVFSFFLQSLIMFVMFIFFFWYFCSCSSSLCVVSSLHVSHLLKGVSFLHVSQLNIFMSAIIFPASSVDCMLLSLPPWFPTGNNACGLPVSFRIFAFSGRPILAPMNVPHLSFIVIFVFFVKKSVFVWLSCISFFSSSSFLSVFRKKSATSLFSFSITMNSFFTCLCSIPIISRCLFAWLFLSIVLFSSFLAFLYHIISSKSSSFFIDSK